jgi:hypothetical protein
MDRDSLQDIHEVGVRIDTVQDARGNQALDLADVVSAELCPAKQPILAPHRDHSQGALEVVRVDRHVGIFRGRLADRLGVPRRSEPLS